MDYITLPNIYVEEDLLSLIQKESELQYQLVSVLQVITDGGELELGVEPDERQLDVSKTKPWAWVGDVEEVETEFVSVVFVSDIEVREVNDSLESSELSWKNMLASCWRISCWCCITCWASVTECRKHCMSSYEECKRARSGVLKRQW